MASYSKEEALKAYELELALADELGDLNRSTDPNHPGNPPASVYQHAKARAEALKRIVDRMDDDGVKVTDGGNF